MRLFASALNVHAVHFAQSFLVLSTKLYCSLTQGLLPISLSIKHDICRLSLGPVK